MTTALLLFLPLLFQPQLRRSLPFSKRAKEDRNELFLEVTGIVGVWVDV